MSFDKMLKFKTAKSELDKAEASSAGVLGLPAVKHFLADYSSDYFGRDGERLHFVDTGAGEYERTAICFHSRYGWAYSFRKIIPKLVFHGFRVIVVDLLGFGLSDKPDDTSRLSVSAQCERVKALIEHLELQELTLIGHEMGASIAAQLPHMLPDRVEALVFANPANRIVEEGWPGLHMWRTLMNAKLEIDVAAEISTICPKLSQGDREAYNAPLTGPNGLLGVRHFHETVVLEEGEPDHAFVENGYRWLREEWAGRAFVLVGTKDPIFGVSTAKKFSKQIGCSKNIIKLEDICGHPFEERPDSIDRAIDELFAA